ncbi:iron-containing redox enzyme family protein [Glutamicibacter endophyticus]
MKLPPQRGPVSAELIDLLRTRAPENDQTVFDDRLVVPLGSEDILFSDDLQLSLFVLYELHYRGFDEVDARWEWNPQLLALRARVEEQFERKLREIAMDVSYVPGDAQAVAQQLFTLANDDGPSVSNFIAREATLEQAREFLIHKSIYQLKEADPHSWAIPRLIGRGKSALMEIQFDEYGAGRPGAMHSELFALTMRGLELDAEFGAYIDRLPAITLASVNMMSLFGLHRRLRGCIAGHLAIYEMTSSIPNARYARGFRRLGFDTPVTDYFDEHVEADAVHEQIAGRDLAGGLIEYDPTIATEVFFGAQAACAVDALVGEHQLTAWRSGKSSLRTATERISA